MLVSDRTGRTRRADSVCRIIRLLVEPTVIPRADHSISRDQIDPDALKVLYRLRKFNHQAYLVGGGVRDLLLGRAPKDFDIGTSARPNEVKRIFRNCWIIGRRFRLAHVKFGPKTIEVATFRRQVPADELAAAEAEDERAAKAETAAGTKAQRRPIRRDNTFGTAEEDAFRRDFTINALFYDIATFSVIDYVGGMADLREGVLRSIGDPNERFIEDPVRMLRAIAFTARLSFALDPPVQRAIRRHKAEIGKASPARMIEELYKLLRSGFAAVTYRSLSEQGLLESIAPEVERRKTSSLWRSLELLDTYRKKLESAPDTLTNPILLGSLVQPVQPLDLTPRRRDDKRPLDVKLGPLPIARRDVERLRQALQIQPKLQDTDLGARAQRAVMHRGAFTEAMTWLEIHGDDDASLGRWKTLVAAGGPEQSAAKRRRRRPRRRWKKTAVEGQGQP
jgi:poly(A) polymerase